MNPYSHLIVALRLLPKLNPSDPADYFWGAVAPDVRYLARVQRGLTHLEPEQIADAMIRYPQLRSFLQGYRVHCLTDEIHLKPLLFQRFPLSLLRKVFSQQRLAVLLELYFFDNENFQPPLSGKHNEFLSELGIEEAASAQFHQAVSRYVASPSYESRMTDMLPVLGLQGDSRIEKYLAAARSFQRHRLVRKVLFAVIKVSRLNEKIMAEAARAMELDGLSTVIQ